jgi:hypothetical protein
MDMLDCLLKPVAAYPDPQRKNGWLVVAKFWILMAPHPTNGVTWSGWYGWLWFGFEQEYILERGKPLGFWPEGYPAPQGPYCAVVWKCHWPQYHRKHLDACLDAGLCYRDQCWSTNRSVEFQVLVRWKRRMGSYPLPVVINFWKYASKWIFILNLYWWLEWFRYARQFLQQRNAWSWR